MAVSTDTTATRASKALRKQADAALRRLQRLYRRLRPEFRQGLSPDLSAIRGAIHDCVGEVSALQRIHRAGPALRRMFGGSSWLSALEAEGYTATEGPADASAGPLAVAPLIEQGRLRRSVEVFFHELGVRVVTAKDQMGHLGQDGLERLEKLREEAHEAPGRLIEYLRTVGQSIDTLVVPVTDELGAAGERAQVMVAQAATAVSRLPRLITLRIDHGRKQLRESLAELGLALTGDRGRVELALDRALALV